MKGAVAEAQRNSAPDEPLPFHAQEHDVGEIVQDE
jgi:hypothetical protein